MAYENKIQDIIKTSLENIRSMIDANTVIGNPINTESGTTIIPISKVSMGFASGGLDYNGKIVKPTPAPTGAQNFGGGGGTGISVSPVGFLVVGADGSVSMINVGDKIPSDPVEQVIDLVERSPEIIDKIVSLIKKNIPENPDSSAPYKEKKSKK